MALPSYATSPVDAEQDRRTIGTLHKSEKWWGDQYYDLKRNGYELRPRYNPDWVPSWGGSGKGFFAVEDGRPSTVRVISLELSVLTVRTSCELRWTPYNNGTAT